MRVHLASDHAGLELKRHLARVLGDDGHEVVDHGPAEFDPEDDYPTTCIPCAEAVVVDAGSLGVVIGGSGNGEQMAANLVPGIRAALAYDTETARLTRRHNDAQVVGIGARMHSVEEATEIVRAFLATDFSGDERHRRRIEQLREYEQSGAAGPA